MAHKYEYLINRITAALNITQAELGRRLKASKSAVNNWRITGIPSEYCKDIELMLVNTTDPMTCKDLRPDDWFKWWPDSKSRKVA